MKKKRIPKPGFTTIRLSDETRDELKARGKKGETYQVVISRLLLNAQASSN